MTSVQSVHQEFADAWNRRDFEKIKYLFHPDYAFTGGDGKEMKGGPDVGAAVARGYAEAFPDGTLEVKRVIASGNLAVAEMIGRGTQHGEFMGVKPTGRRVEITICNVMELRDGKVYREHEYMDTLTIMSQLGALNLQAVKTA